MLLQIIYILIYFLRFYISYFSFKAQYYLGIALVIFYIEIVISFSLGIAVQWKVKSRITFIHDILGKYDVTQTFMRVMWQNTAGQGNIIPTIRDKIFWSIPCKTDIHDDQGLRQIQRKMFSKQSFISFKQTLVFSFDWYFELLMNFC